MSRKYTKKLLEMNGQNWLDKDNLILSLLNWMSESDVEEFYKAYEYDALDENDEEDLENSCDETAHYKCSI